jgi:hypothetical protein
VPQQRFAKTMTLMCNKQSPNTFVGAAWLRAYHMVRVAAGGCGSG